MEIFENTKIIIVEDDLNISSHLEATLKDLGYQVIANCNSGESFLKLIDDKMMPDLLIININLGGKFNGIETVDQLKTKIDIPVIYLASNSNNAIIQRAKQTKPAAFLFDPFNESQVYSAVEISIHCYVKTNELLTEQKKVLDMNQLQINELVETQNHLIAATWRERDLKDELKNSKSIIETQNKSILDSINYAKRIQQAILPDHMHIKELLPDSFLIYRPKDIVSGDFYFIEPIKSNDGKDLVGVVVADSTGHGVPGALISVLGMSLLKQYLLEGQVNSPAEALDHLNQKLSIMLRQQDKDEVKDGMDITYCMIDYKTLKLSYAGAHNPLWIVKRSKATNLNNRSASKIKNSDVHKYELIEIKADKQPIGYSDSPRPFTNHEIQLEPGDTFYIFSDGYADQFGGPKGKKFKTSKLKELLISIQDNNLTTQKELLVDAFKSWQGDQEQVDDVCFMGVRV